MFESSLASASLVGFIWANRRVFAPGLGLALCRILAIAPFPIVFKSILDTYMPAKNVAGILALSALMLVLLGVHQFLIVRGAVRIGRAVTTLTLRLRAHIFTKIQFLSFGYLDRQKTGRLLAKYAFDTQKIEGVLMPVLNGFVPDSFYSVLTLAILLVMNWQLSFVIMLMLPIMGFMRWRYFQHLRQKHEANRVAQEKMVGTASEMFGALRLVRSYGEEKQARSQMRSTDKEVARARVDLIGTSSGFGAFSFSATKFLSFLVVAGGAILAIYGQVSTGTVIAFVAGLPSLMQPIQMFTQLSDQYFVGSEAYRSIKELLDELDTEPWQGTRTLESLAGNIEFENVSFRYSGASRDALHGFNLKIQSGQKVALVGTSGAGKITVASLLLGLYSPTAGQIRIDGVPQADLDMRWLRQNTALVMQENILLSSSVQDNIRFARTDASDEEVVEAIRLAHAMEFIERMPEGLDTIVGERGVMLSGGQRQRISIARALLRNPTILILDEPTSALDYESERLIQDALDTLSQGRTVITIAHRLSTIRSADLVVVLHDGKVVEQGDFETLCQQRGYFHKMLAAQGLDQFVGTEQKRIA